MQTSASINVAPVTRNVAKMKQWNNFPAAYLLSYATDMLGTRTGEEKTRGTEYTQKGIN